MTNNGKYQSKRFHTCNYCGKPQKHSLVEFSVGRKIEDVPVYTCTCHNSVTRWLSEMCEYLLLYYADQFSHRLSRKMGYEEALERALREEAPEITPKEQS